MNRLGKAILIVIVVALIAFFAMVRLGGGSIAGSTAAPASQPPVSPPPNALVLPSGLVMPVAGTRPEQLSDSFGDPRGGGERGHGALDIMAPTGTPVLAAAPGTIEKIFESADGGHTVYVRSPDRRFVYYYAHLNAYAPGLSEGMYVEQGRQIATVGATGDASAEAPHLHFEIKRMAGEQSWHEGEPLNPYPLLAGNARPG
jgi:murein DD-endopeptidase MepM/ murein hydrolase activator NlpD